MPEFTSAAVPDVGADDHLAGDGPEAIVYLDFACAHCAAAWGHVRGLPLRLCFRHFPMPSKHPRSSALHAAAEAAAAQGSFWEMADSLFAERGRVDEPHLWERVEALGLDLDRFQRDRRSRAIADRVRRDFRSGVRAGIVGTPAAFAGGVRLEGDIERALGALAG
jgi:protein-disulfide isomerase